MEFELNTTHNALFAQHKLDVDKPSKSETELAEAAQEFEAYMLNSLLSEMQKTVQSSGLFDDSKYEGYQSLIYDALSKKAAEAGTFGLAKQMLSQLKDQP